MRIGRVALAIAVAGSLASGGCRFTKSLVHGPPIVRALDKPPDEWTEVERKAMYGPDGEKDTYPIPDHVFETDPYYNGCYREWWFYHPEGHDGCRCRKPRRGWGSDPAHREDAG